MIKKLFKNIQQSLSEYSPIIPTEQNKKSNMHLSLFDFFLDFFIPIIFWTIAVKTFVVNQNDFNFYVQLFVLIIFFRYGLKLFKSINLIVYANSLKHKKITVEKRNDQLRSIEYSNTLFNSNTTSIVFYSGILYFLISNLTWNFLISSIMNFNSILILFILNFILYLNQFFLKSKIVHTIACLSFIASFIIFPNNLFFLISLFFNLLYLNDIRKKIGKLNYNLVQTSVICNLCLLCVQLNFS